ncbi:hypothetical protein JB92DRAFT_3092610 [Gautieria morchelliformis]|nr:hypothetical protein JB92DRAFT_3092610 [Gautieria morchelliformis]
MDPIPPATFYGNLMSTPGSDAMIDPMLLGNTTNVSRPPSTAVSAPPVAPPLRSTVESMDSTAWKGHEEFSLKDLEPACGHRHQPVHGAAQQDRLVQDQGHCLNRDVDTLKNKVGSMLAWVEGGKKTSVHSPLGRELGRDSLVFASLSGKLDVIQHLKQMAKDTREEEREKAKEYSHACRARRHPG